MNVAMSAERRKRGRPVSSRGPADSEVTVAPRAPRTLGNMSSSRNGRERGEVDPVGWRGWDDRQADVIRERILRGDYNSPAVVDGVARRLIAAGAI